MKMVVVVDDYMVVAEYMVVDEYTDTEMEGQCGQLVLNVMFLEERGCRKSWSHHHPASQHQLKHSVVYPFCVSVMCIPCAAVSLLHWKKYAPAVLVLCMHHTVVVLLLPHCYFRKETLKKSRGMHIRCCWSSV